ncbi:glycosyltransferase [Lichenihabitans psoromatis]|uniref:glycosyltransferase n=1 Tax=Lichenihabitans psoromatis TaxID=2528642 RepID=UPI001036CBAE|nr:glycosyltransferase [Lichenihabitans psoromatis]
MNVLFVHNNFPAQFRNLAESLIDDPAYTVAAIGSQTAQALPGSRLQTYSFVAKPSVGTHPFARRFDIECRRAEHVLYAAIALKQSGFMADVIVVHCGWGESLPLRSVFPSARIVVYCEFYYRFDGLDVHFDPESPRFGTDGQILLHAKNASTLLALAEADLGISPTAWQRSTYPLELQSKIKVCHEGVDTKLIKPNAAASLQLPSGRILTKADRIVTYVARSLEPHRGFHIFMRALPQILSQNPEAQIVVIGDNGVSYGVDPGNGSTWKDAMLAELGDRLALDHVHFLGRVPYDVYQATLQISTVHVYLTYPFVLSWSLIEAMATGCCLVASNTAPVQEVLNDDSAILVPFLDHAALADAVGTVLANPQAFESLGTRARLEARTRYDKGILVRKMRRLLGMTIETPIVTD